MKFSVNREDLLRPLQQVAGVVERRQTLPVLANLLMRVRDGQLSMTGTDLEVELIGRVAVNNPEEGEITVPARKLVDICREIPEKADIEFTLSDNRVEIRSGRFDRRFQHCLQSIFHQLTSPVPSFQRMSTARG